MLVIQISEIRCKQGKAKKDIKPEVNAKEVAMRPTDMPNKGFVNK